MQPEPRWNATGRPYPRAEVVHELVRAQGARRPEATALIDGDLSVSYGVLDAASDTYAEILRELGVAPGDAVPVLMPRSARLIAVLLAILKRGAAYAALDTRWPDDRLTGLLGQFRGSVLVSDEPGRRGPLPIWAPLGDDLRAVAAEARTRAPVVVAGDAACSIFFTSGTTGEPKCVVSPHRGTVRLFQDCDFAEFSERTVMPQAAPLSWDAFNLELWSTLMNGGTAVLVRGAHLLPGELRQLVAQHGVNTVWLTSSLFNLYVDEDLDAFRGVRHLMIGGERLSTAHVRRFLERHPDIRLINGYGPVESTIFATTHPISAADCADGTEIPIGSPVANTQVYIVDRDLLCRVGQPGEICIAGDGLAIGYLGDAALTAEKFTTLTVGGASVRIYRTGDLGYWSGAGLLHFCGRADRQVKIRGHRIEPAEIERVAGTIAGIGWSTALPLANGDTTYQKMSLFFRTVGGVQVDPGVLAGELRRRLPEYLVPDELYEIENIPLTPTGKLDQRALIDLATQKGASAAAAAGAAGSTEARSGAAADVGSTQAMLAASFAAVLGVSDVPCEVSFFALGGTSLDATRLCIRVESRLGAVIPVSQLIRTPDVASLAAWLDEDRADGVDDDLHPRRVPLMPMQVGFLLRQLLNPDDLSGVCRMAWWLDGPVDEPALSQAVQDVTLRHEALRARYLVEDDPVAIVDAAARVGWHPLPDAPDETTAWSALEDALVRPLRVAEGQVWRAGLARARDTGRTLLALAVHHIAFDEWSERILCAELATAYRARAARVEPTFARPAPTLVQAVSGYRGQLRYANLDVQRTYWRRALHDLPRLSIPKVAGVGTGVPAALRWEVTAAQLAVWDDTARARAMTRFGVLLAGYADALRKVTGQPDFAVGTPVARRGSRVLGDALTCLIDVVCIRLRLGLANDPESMLRRVDHAAREALAAQELPFSEVVELLNPSRSAGSNPLYQAMFSLHEGQPDLRLPGCTSQFQRSEVSYATCDLVMGVWPAADGSCSIHLAHRPDLVPVEFARAVGNAYYGVLRDGPASLSSPRRSVRGGHRERRPLARRPE